MSMASSFVRRCVCVGLFAMSAILTPAAQTSVPSNPQLQEARKAYDATDFEGARMALTAMIAEWSVSTDDATKPLLAAAYELRGRTLQNLRDLDGARNDWRAMLLLVPGYTFPVEAGPRALALFEEVRATTIGMVDIAISPADAEVRVDGRLIPERPLRLSLADGPHTVAATRRSHRSAEQTFIVKAGETTTVPLALERTRTTVTFSAIPSQVEVLVNGQALGGGAVPVGGGAVAGDLQVSVTSRSTTQPEPATASGPAAAFVMEDVPTGRYTLDFRAPCFVSEQRALDVQRPQEIRLDTIRLTPARAEVSVQSDAADARIVTSSGITEKNDMRPPQVLSLCAGPYVVQVRSPLGRDVRRYDLKTGQKEQFTARVRPAFALVPGAEPNAAGAVGRDLRLTAEQAFRDTSNVTLFVADDGSGSLPSTTTAERRAVVTRVVRDIGAQGLAGLSRDAANPETLTLTLWSPGSGRPDTIRWRAGDAASVAEAIRRLDARPVLTRAWVGVLAIDVIDVGVVVAATEPGSAGAAAGLQQGDVVVTAGGRPLSTAADLLTAAEAREAGQTLPLEVRDRAGASRRVELVVSRVPRVIDPLDQTVLPNTLAVYLAGRLQSKLPPLDEAAVRLNLAVAQIQAEAWVEARAELETVEALATKSTLSQPVQNAISGSAAYLLGIAAEKSGDAAGAEAAWTRAAQVTGPLLLDSGGAIREQAERRLAALRQSRVSP